MPPPMPPRYTGTFDLTNSMSQIIEATVKMTVEETLAQYIENNPYLPELPEFLTKQQAADRLKISVASLDKMRKEGKILTAYIGPTVRIPSTEITKFLKDLV